ncbi:DsbA family protein [Nocardioides sp.]|uniref:DsbA family oxidoreductase n=1 Tax=Nocardioides sp. TaxID=35761 RepID=UPI00271B3B5E|nr:DsbA family oxidoreductase [Nocardioides sp.]MDO9455928.1 DsbA family oxidoreductase [Nocardioides sp.]
MRIEIWSDVVCPWCYIGKRRLEEALAGFEHRDQVEVVWRSFQLDPSAPTVPTENVADMIGRKYGGGPDAARQMMSQVQQVASEVGLDFTRHADGLHLNTVDAHRLLHAAGDRRGDLKEAMLNAYFVEARNLADHDVLTELAVSVGLDADEARAVLSSDAHRAEVDADAAQAQAYGATGVPFFVVDATYGVSGAQPTEVFAQLLDQAWAARSPLTMVSAGAAPGCDGDECAI